MGTYTRAMQLPAGMCSLTLSLMCVAENFPVAIYRVYVPCTYKCVRVWLRVICDLLRCPRNCVTVAYVSGMEKRHVPSY